MLRRKRILILERMPREQRKKLLEMKKQHDILVARALVHFLAGDINQALAQYTQAIHSMAGVQLERQLHLEQALQKMQQKLERRFPELKRKREIRVVFRYGTMHTRLYYLARKLGIKAQRVMPGTPFYFEPTSALQRKIIQGTTPEKQDVAQALLGTLIVSILEQTIGKTSNISAFAHWAVRRLLLSDFNRITEKMRDSYRSPHQGQKFVEILKEEGITLPSTRWELEAFLKRKGIKPSKT